MEQESNNIGIIGAGPAGCCAAYFLKDFCNVTLIDSSSPLRTILPTGGGRCNLTYNENNFKSLAENYPRGEKFLYSVFSRFSPKNTIDLFEHLGIKTYIQEDNRIFPISNSSKEVRNVFLNNLNNTKIIKEECISIIPKENKYIIRTNKKEYSFSKIIIAIGGHSNYDILQPLELNIIPPKPSLVGLITKEDFRPLAGTSIYAKWGNLYDSLLFTHKGVSGPLIYKISSLKARDTIPYTITLNICPELSNLQDILNKNPHKQINNLLSEFLPLKVVNQILPNLNIDITKKCHTINGKIRDSIMNKLNNFEINIINHHKDGEVVTAGGVDLKEINSKSMECKKHKGLYFIGEILDIDGFCGGFNLQNCWSTAFVATDSIIKSILE